jgi:hypothetical protein
MLDIEGKQPEGHKKLKKPGARMIEWKDKDFVTDMAKQHVWRSREINPAWKRPEPVPDIEGLLQRHDSIHQWFMFLEDSLKLCNWKERLIATMRAYEGDEDMLCEELTTQVMVFRDSIRIPTLMMGSIATGRTNFLEEEDGDEVLKADVPAGQCAKMVFAGKIFGAEIKMVVVKSGHDIRIAHNITLPNADREMQRLISDKRNGIASNLIETKLVMAWLENDMGDVRAD